MSMPQERKLAGEVPGPGSRALEERRRQAVARGVATMTPVYAAAAHGAVLEDVDGNRFIDFTGGLGVLNAGHTPAPVVQAVKDQVERYLHTCQHAVMNEPYVAVAEALNRITPGDYDKRTLLVNSGAEATENVVKIARAATGRPAVVVFDNAFHGRTLLALAMTGKVTPTSRATSRFRARSTGSRTPTATAARSTSPTPTAASPAPTTSRRRSRSTSAPRTWPA